MTIPSLASMLLFLLAMSNISLASTLSKRISYKNVSYDLFIVKPPFTHLNLHWKTEHKKLIGNFKSLKSVLKKKNRTLTFAMNAGIFAPQYKLLGLHVENSKIIKALNKQRGYGNFYILPNGVFLITKTGQAKLIQTRYYKHDILQPKLATQSGPMMVFNNRIHWLFKKKAHSKNIRNGVGINKKGHIIFAISNSAVNFYSFAALFRTKLQCSNALYLDGSISKMYLPSINRKELSGKFSGIFSYSSLIKNN